MSFGPLEWGCCIIGTTGLNGLRWKTESEYFHLSNCICIPLGTEMSLAGKKCSWKYFSYFCLTRLVQRLSKIYLNFWRNWTTCTFLVIALDWNIVESSTGYHSTRNESGIPKMTLFSRLKPTRFLYILFTEKMLVGFIDNIIDVKNERRIWAEIHRSAAIRANMHVEHFMAYELAIGINHSQCYTAWVPFLSKV